MSFNELCRTCLCPTDNESTILDVIDSDPMSTPIVIKDLLKSLPQIDFADCVQLPGRVCFLCVTQMKKIHSFIVSCKKNEKLLKQITGMNDRVSVPTSSSDLREDDEKIPPRRFRISTVSSSTKPKRRKKIVKDDNGGGASQNADEKPIKAEPIDEVLPATDLYQPEIKIETMDEPEDNSTNSQAPPLIESVALTMPVYIKEEPELELDADVISLSSSDESDAEITIKKQSNARLWCARCEGQFTTKRNYDAHLSKCSQLLECDECLMAFQDPKELAAHSLKHHPHRDMSQSDNTLSDGEITAKDQNFPPRLTLKPQDSHENQRFSCSYCPKQFSAKQRLESHIKCHSNSHYCAKCMKSFRTSHHLKAHNMRVHGASWKSIHCGVCKRYFACNADFVRHQLTHTKEKPYHCNMCPEKYRYKKFLQNHMQQSHPEVSEEAVLEYLKEKYGKKTLPEILDSTFTCYMCRMVVDRSNLAEHVNSHKID